MLQTIYCKTLDSLCRSHRHLANLFFVGRYSGGRDGIVCAWDIRPSSGDGTGSTKATHSLRAQTGAHTNWINDITLVQNNSAVVSASSDLAVKIWRPNSEEHGNQAVKIGQHADYIKCVASSRIDKNAPWVASGALDRKICLWDLNGGGKTLEIDVTGEEIPEKGSVYALGLGRNLLACGGPEKTVRLYDPRSGSKVSKLMGHVANIRSILIDDNDDTILSASADKTIKLWSVRGGRCMYTFTMHDDSVWNLFSDDPTLGIFYSSDRSGMIAKTDVRGGIDDIDNGLSLAVAQEHVGICRVVAANGQIWAATDRSSINAWADVDTGADVQLPQPYRHHRQASLASNKSVPTTSPPLAMKKKDINPQSVLKISTMATLTSRSTFDASSGAVNEPGSRKGSVVAMESTETEVLPVHQMPDDTIEGQFGLLKHKLLNDRRRVLTLDTAGDVLMWDLLQCKTIQSFGKQHMEDIEVQVNTQESVAPWCSIDVSSGNLTVVLEPFNCFDGEVYADELQLDEAIEFKEDQRISLGKWVLRYLFANLIDEEIKRDEAHRKQLNDEIERKLAAAGGSATMSLDLAPPVFDNDDIATPTGNGDLLSPGIAVGLASPGLSEQGTTINGSNDISTSGIAPVEGAKPAETEGKTSTELSDKDKGKDKDKAAEGGKTSGGFGKKFRMSFSSKKLGRSVAPPVPEKTAVEEKAIESESSSNHEKEVDDSFYGIIQKIRNEYERNLTDRPTQLVETGVTPSLPADTPVLKIPPGTQIMIQEETSGGSSTIYQGSVETIGNDADIIEQKAPMWLGAVLLQNQIPFKEPAKISFVLHPMDGLPAVATDGNNRLNANRMLRVRKILAYVLERIDGPGEPGDQPDDPESLLELQCNSIVSTALVDA